MPNPIDLPIALDALRHGQDWGPCAQSDSTYEQLAANWRGPSPVPTEAELNAAWVAYQTGLPAALVNAQRAAAKLVAAQESPIGQILRAELLVMMDEVNALRGRCRAQDAAIAAAVSLAELKVRWATLPAVPDRTSAQIKPALLARIDTPDAD